VAIIWNTRDNAGGFGGYTNGSWSSFMNTYAVRFTMETSGAGSAYEGVTFSRNYSVFFPYSGDYTITAAVDNSGTLNIGGVNFTVANFNTSATTVRYYNKGTYTLSLSVVNAPSSDVYSSNPYGIAITVDAPPQPPAPSVSFTLSSSSICAGSSATLSWNVTGQVDSVSINQGIGTVAVSGNRTVSPTSTTTYTITASGEGGTTTRSVTLTVNQPTSTNITADNSTIIRGQCTILRWNTTGDATSATINQGIGSVNINGNRQVCPTQTTTYTINVTGICTNSSSSVTVIVYQPPTVNLTGPVSLNYGQQGILTYESTNADISLTLKPTYQYKNGELSGPMFDVNLPIGSVSNGQVTTQIPYNDFGPFSVIYTIVATGNGGQETKQITIPINIDETPDNFLVPESEDLFKDQAPIVTADATITSYQMLINGIDIPVEIKADKPILVDKNSQQNWKRIRKI
jgi:hypothetical protein